MVHSIELLFDEPTETALRRLWVRLAEAGLPSGAAIRAVSNRPHVTLAVAERIDGAVDEALAGLTHLLPLCCVVGAPLLFGAGRLTLARLIVPSAALLDLQARVYAAGLPHMSPGPAPHSEPGQWTPHTTLARRLRPDQVGRALSAVRGDITGRLLTVRHWDGDKRTEQLLDHL